MRCLVTGAAGFVGSHLCDVLVDEGHEVIGIDNFLVGHPSNVNPKVKFLFADFARQNLMPHFAEIDWVFHLGALARTKWCIEDPTMSHDINLSGTLNMLEWSRAAEVKRFIYASSNIVYAPSSHYKVQKLAAEGYVNTYRDIFDLSTTILRYSNVYGTKRQSEIGPHPNVLASMRRTARNEGAVWVTGDGTQTRDFVHVFDAAWATYLAAQSDTKETIDICTGVQTSIINAAQYFNVDITYQPERTADAQELIQDPVRAFEILGFTAEIDFDRGMTNYVNGA